MGGGGEAGATTSSPTSSTSRGVAESSGGDRRLERPVHVDRRMVAGVLCEQRGDSPRLGHLECSRVERIVGGGAGADRLRGEAALDLGVGDVRPGPLDADERRANGTAEIAERVFPARLYGARQRTVCRIGSRRGSSSEKPMRSLPGPAKRDDRSDGSTCERSHSTYSSPRSARAIGTFMRSHTIDCGCGSVST